MRHNTSSPATAARPRRSGLTLIELLLVVSIVAILIAIVMPAVGIVKAHARTITARDTVAELWNAIQDYADENPRHLYPTPASTRYLTYSSSDPWTVLAQLSVDGYQVPGQLLDHAQDSPTFGCLLDPWHRPYFYSVDGPVLTTSGVVDTSRMNGVADRPASIPSWNPQGIEPYAYVWSVGPPVGTLSDDSDPAHASAWIYARSTR
jgi:prepilin-type N-terminal cleavage/methylation domain-containing protein